MLGKIRDLLTSGGGILIICLVTAWFTLQQGQRQPAGPAPLTREERAARFARFTSQLERSIDSLVQSRGINGLSFAITYNDSLVHTAAFGMADTATAEPLTIYHRFRVASVSKLFTAVAIMKMAEEGKIGLQQSVFGPGGILPADSVHLGDPRIKEITVQHLLTHSAGWSRRSFGDPMFMNQTIAAAMRQPLPVSFDAVMQFVLEHRLPFAPGTMYDYSNFGYCLLGRVIEQVSGLTYEACVQQQVLQPCGIRRAQIGGSFSEDRLPREVVYYDLWPGNERTAFDGSGKTVPAPYGGTDLTLLGAAGGWVATPSDLLKLAVHINGNPAVPDILSENSIESMVKSYEPGGVPIGWRATNGSGTWWRTGTLAGTAALVVRQNRKICWAVLINTSGFATKGFKEDFYQMVSSALDSENITWPDHNLFR